MQETLEINLICQISNICSPWSYDRILIHLLHILKCPDDFLAKVEHVQTHPLIRFAQWLQKCHILVKNKSPSCYLFETVTSNIYFWLEYNLHVQKSIHVEKEYTNHLLNGFREQDNGKFFLLCPFTIKVQYFCNCTYCYCVFS